jgi:hypothetical protein
VSSIFSLDRFVLANLDVIYSRAHDLSTFIRAARCGKKSSVRVYSDSLRFLSICYNLREEIRHALRISILDRLLRLTVLATGVASMADIWDIRTRDYMIAIWGCFAILAPVLGPLVGGFAYTAKGWT